MTTIRNCVLTLFGAGLGLGLHAQTVLLTHKLDIKPIYLNDGSGTTAVLSNSSYVAKISIFQEATQKVFAQAGIRVNWLSSTTYTDSGFFLMNGLPNNGGDTTAEMHALTQATTIQNGQATTHGQSTDPRVLNLFFTGVSGGTYGVSEQSFYTSSSSYTILNGATVSESAFASDYLFVIPHEIGHSLGLNHGSNTIENLMYAGNASVTSLGDIYPDGLDRSQLTSAQITTIKAFYGVEPDFALIKPNSVANDYYTYNAIPEPQACAATIGLLVGVFTVTRRYRKRKPRAHLASPTHPAQTHSDRCS